MLESVRHALGWLPEKAVHVTGTPEHSTSPLAAVSKAMVALHKEQFGRGPTNARSHFAGPDALVCVLEDALLPAERKMVERGEEQRVRESRIAFQVATTDEFVSVVEQILQRKVRAFASATDVLENVVFENFVFEPEPATDGDAPTG
jgi:uncharacterized protein YbcI